MLFVSYVWFHAGLLALARSVTDFRPPMLHCTRISLRKHLLLYISSPRGVADKCRVSYNAGWELLQRVHEVVQGPRRHIASRASLGPAVPVSRQLSCAYSRKVAAHVFVALCAEKL
jgi:hypothetical protein